MTFIEFIRFKGFTIASLAEASGISRRTLEQYTAGRRSFAKSNAAIAVDLAGTLGITVRELIEFDEKK